MPDPILRDLRLVTDETLYARLVLLRQRFPADSASEDWLYRCDTWEMANKAVRAEIRRRKAAPPAWWAQAPPAARQRDKRLIGIIMCAYFAVLALVAVRFGLTIALVALAATALVPVTQWLAGQLRPHRA